MSAYPPIVDRQWIDKQVPASMNTDATIAEVLDAVFSIRSVSYQILNKL
jgi:hypothetical protein